MLHMVKVQQKRQNEHRQDISQTDRQTLSDIKQVS